MEKFRNYLQEEYLRRRDRNPNYSVRSFARALKVDSGSLSQYLNGRRDYSLKKIKDLAIILGLEKNHFLTLLGKKTEGLKVVEFDRLHLLSKWYYAAIIESLDLNNFKPSAEWIAKRLGISTSVANIAINQLFAAGVLTLNADGSWGNNWQNYTTHSNENVDELPLREHQKQLLKLAAQSIDYNSGEKKSHTAVVTTVDEDLIPEIKEEIKKFRRKINDLIEKKSKKKNSIYCMQINLFPEVGNAGGSNE